MAATDNDSALICREGGFQIRSMFELLKGQRDGSVYLVYTPLNFGSDSSITLWHMISSHKDNGANYQPPV